MHLLWVAEPRWDMREDMPMRMHISHEFTTAVGCIDLTYINHFYDFRLSMTNIILRQGLFYMSSTDVHDTSELQSIFKRTRPSTYPSNLRIKGEKKIRKNISVTWSLSNRMAVDLHALLCAVITGLCSLSAPFSN